MKATGTNTAISTAVVVMIGPVTSFIAARAASRGRKPASSCQYRIAFAAKFAK